ncbi:hypothetical protein MKW94_001177 [Papaver nudicaule]|uniref:Uncharacterized protein n=1 Tax=Papaver nudicaule TaxID=74823 RepID=A0AA42AX46_PAPNU|nr:hypothetical protein [Papaver nudicaule]
MKSHTNGCNDDSTSEQQPPDFPAESFYLSKEEEFDWVDRNAFYERKDSTKGKPNSSSTTTNTHHNHSHSHSHSSTSASSQRFSLKSKSSIIGLPKAPQNTCKFRHTSNGKAPTNVRFFPKRSRSKSSVQDAEPSSPKVSCIGRVRSRRQRLRQLSRQRSATTTVTAVKQSKSKFWMSFKSVLCLRCRDNRAVNIADGGSTETASTSSKKSEKRKSSSSSNCTSTVAEPHGMNDLKRFASGRRYDSLGVNDV